MSISSSKLNVFLNKNKYSDLSYTKTLIRKLFRMHVTKIILDEKEIPLIVTKSIETMSYVKGHHVKHFGFLLQKNVYWVKENQIIQRINTHLHFGRSGKFAKTTFYFLRADELSSCKVITTGKPINSGESDGMQLPCELIFSGEKECIGILQKQVL